MKENSVLLTFTKKGFPVGRMIFGSKSGYRDTYPSNMVVFNANIIDAKTKDKIWYGDLDITFDTKKLTELAIQFNTEYLVLYESDAIDGKDFNVGTHVWSTKSGLCKTLRKYFDDNLLKKGR